MKGSTHTEESLGLRLRRLLNSATTESKAIDAICGVLSELKDVLGVSIIYKESKERFGVVQKCCGCANQLEDDSGMCGTVYYLSHMAIEKKRYTVDTIPAGNINVYVHSFPMCRNSTCFGCISFIALSKEERPEFREIAEAATEFFERHITSTEISRSIEIMARIFSVIDEAIWIVDKEGNIIECNPAVESVFGIPRSQCLGKKCYEVVHSSDSFPDICSKIRNTEEGRLQLIISKGDKTYSISMYKFKDEVFGDEFIVHIARDITKYIHFHMHLAQSERMRAIERIIAGINHELNNPITAIIGFSDVLYETEKDKERKALLGYINREAKRCADVIKSVMTLSPGAHPEISTVDVNTVVKNIAELKNYYHRSQGIEVELRLDENIPPVQISPYALQQSLLNIITNAEDALEGKDERRIIIETGREGDWVYVSVEDTGGGIPDEIMDSIFDPFFSTKPKEEGTGIGLTVAKELLSKEGGDIRVRNTEKGAKFIIYIPAERHLSAEYTTRLELAGHNILVVSGESAVMDYVSRLLVRHGASVCPCATFEECMEKLNSSMFSWIIMDLPYDGDSSLNPVEFVKGILDKKPAMRGKIVVLTYGFHKVEEQRALVELGCRIIFKPFTEEDLIDELK